MGEDGTFPCFCLHRLLAFIPEIHALKLLIIFQTIIGVDFYEVLKSSKPDLAMLYNAFKLRDNLHHVLWVDNICVP